MSGDQNDKENGNHYHVSLPNLLLSFDILIFRFLFMHILKDVRHVTIPSFHHVNAHRPFICLRDVD